jgi:hypothetical protein
MFDRFTDRARKVVGLARECAFKSHHTMLGDGHLLMGLFKERDGIAAAALQRLDVSWEALNAQYLKAHVSMVQEELPVRALPQVARLTKVLERAVEIAHGLKCTYIGTEHLLLALVSSSGEGGRSRSMLEGLGLSTQAVKKEVFELLGVEDPEGGPTIEGWDFHPGGGGLKRLCKADCTAYAVKGSDYCLAHTPPGAIALKEALKCRNPECRSLAYECWKGYCYDHRPPEVLGLPLCGAEGCRGPRALGSEYCSGCDITMVEDERFIEIATEAAQRQLLGPQQAKVMVAEMVREMGVKVSQAFEPVPTEGEFAHTVYVCRRCARHSKPHSAFYSTMCHCILCRDCYEVAKDTRIGSQAHDYEKCRYPGKIIAPPMCDHEGCTERATIVDGGRAGCWKLEHSPLKKAPRYRCATCEASMWSPSEVLFSATCRCTFCGDCYDKAKDEGGRLTHLSTCDKFDPEYEKEAVPTATALSARTVTRKPRRRGRTLPTGRAVPPGSSRRLRPWERKHWRA